MIPEKINNLFQFIEFLHSNIDNFKQYDQILNEIRLQRKELSNTNPNKNYKGKFRQIEIKPKLDKNIETLQRNITLPIKTKAIELNICDPNKFETLWNWNITAVSEFIESFTETDLPEILKYKDQYYKFKAIGYLDNFIFELDEILHELFNYFTDKSEIEQFENKVISENSELYETIKKQLEPFLNKFNSQNDYTQAVRCLMSFFSNKPITLDKPVFVKSGVVKKIAFALGEIWRSNSNDVISYEYLNYCKQLFSILDKQEISKENLFGCNFYKYAISTT
jgi:hypothetical protein